MGSSQSVKAKVKDGEKHNTGKESKLDFTNLKCEDHSAFCCLFCKSCDQLVCPTCLAKGHKSHDFIEISEGYKQKWEILNEIRDNAGELYRHFISIQDNLERFKSFQNDKRASEIKKMEDHRKALKEEVDAYIDKLISDLNFSHEEVLEAVNKDVKMIQQVEQDTDAKCYEIMDLLFRTKDSNKFFRDVPKMEKSEDIDIPQTPSILMSTPTFVPKNINIVDIGELQRDSDAALSCDQINIEIIDQYQSELDAIFYICPCPDGLWIGDGDYVHKVTHDRNNLDVVSTVETIHTFYGMASTASGDLLISIHDSTLQQISCNSGEITGSDTQYSVAPLIATSIHITQEGKVLVGSYDDINNNKDKRQLFVMDRDGRHERTYEYDNHGKPLLIYPGNIAITSNGNIHVVDRQPIDIRGRVVVLSKEGGCTNIYNGHPSVNKVIPFLPKDIATTPGDNVMVVDYNTCCLHFLDNTGHTLTIYDLQDIGIQHPVSLAFSSTGSLWIGCTTIIDDSDMAKLYHVSLSGCLKQNNNSNTPIQL